MTYSKTNLFRGILIYAFTLNFLFSFGQTVDLSNGLSINSFSRKADQGNSNNFESSYGYGYIGKLGYTTARSKNVALRIEAGFENYSGRILSREVGRGGSTEIDANISKSIITVAFYPLNIRSELDFIFNLGIQYSILVGENWSGTKSGEVMGESWIMNLSEEGDNSNSSNFDITGRIAHALPISDHLRIIPQISFAFSLIDEFDGFPKDVKSRRFQLGIALEKKIK